MTDNEKVIEYLENFIPEMAAAAIRQAYFDALSSGNSVVISENGEIKEIFPDGTVKFIEKTTPMIPIEKGKIIKIK